MPRTRTERRVLLVALIAAAAILALGATAFAAVGSSPTSVAPPSTKAAPARSASAPATPSVAATSAAATGTVVSAKGSYALDFTLPTYGKSGCLVCHGDPSLVVAKGDSTHSFWIDEAQYRRSAHAGVICTGCHVDYGYKAPHGQPGSDWRAVAKQSCKNCHSSQFEQWGRGSHAIRPAAGEPDPKAALKPLCGDCHGGHDMPITKNDPAGKARLRAQAQQMCGRQGCHPDYWDNYSDYYHGAAYKAGAVDAPACWQCHGTHQMLVSTDRFAPTNKENLGGADSCGQTSCHKDVTLQISSYVPLIHGRAKAVQQNPVYSLVSRLLGRKN